MKKIRNRSLIVWFLAMAFVAGMIYFTVELIANANTWAMQPQNNHLSSNGLAKAGTITDRNGVVLAESSDGERVYNDDESIRKATMHVVGDNSRNIDTAIQNVYRSELTGFSFIFGLGMPDGLQTGRNIKLTIDSELNKTAYEALDSNKGAVFVYNYKTGEVLCSASTPTYDPENVPEISDDDEEYEGVYLNRSISSTYPPGSTFKLVTAAAALENMSESELENRTYYCTGSEEIGGHVVNCYSAHGELDFKEALAQSCNCYFAHLAIDLGKEKMTEQANKMGYNSSFGLDSINTAKSHYDVTDADENALGWSGVGQYTDLASPMNVAIISGAIANGGTPVMPYIVSEISLPFGIPSFGASGKTGSAMMSKQTAETLTDMMAYTAQTQYAAESNFNLDICAKTGTAEVGGDEAAHAWITGFSRDESCPLAFAVIVENGDSGYYAALPVASAVMNRAYELYSG